MMINDCCRVYGNRESPHSSLHYFLSRVVSLAEIRKGMKAINNSHKRDKDRFSDKFDGRDNDDATDQRMKKHPEYS